MRLLHTTSAAPDAPLDPSSNQKAASDAPLKALPHALSPLLPVALTPDPCPQNCHLQGSHERAALLYMKGGKLNKAVDMCFAAQLFDVLSQIADNLSAGGDPELYLR